jgi:hypothetical protein
MKTLVNLVLDGTKSKKRLAGILAIMVLAIGFMVCLGNGGTQGQAGESKQTTTATDVVIGSTYCFPRPAYDSGWISTPMGSTLNKTLTHGLGGDVDDYVVDLQYKVIGITGQPNITNRSIGNTFYYSNLKTNSITITGPASAFDLSISIRVRIWVYNCGGGGTGGACCDSSFSPGDRVRLLVDYPRWADLTAGALGTVICCDYDDPELPIFVSWDGWSNGRNSDYYCDSGIWSYPANSGWWMSCDEISRAWILLDRANK